MTTHVRLYNVSVRPPTNVPFVQAYWYVLFVSPAGGGTLNVALVALTALFILADGRRRAEQWSVRNHPLPKLVEAQMKIIDTMNRGSALSHTYVHPYTNRYTCICSHMYMQAVKNR